MLKSIEKYYDSLQRIVDNVWEEVDFIYTVLLNLTQIIP